MRQLFLIVLAIVVVASCAPRTASSTGQSQLENYVINGVRRLDHTIELPPLTPSQAGQIKVIIDQSRREATDWEKSQQVKTYLRKIS